MMKPILDKFSFYIVKLNWSMINKYRHISNEEINEEDEKYPYGHLLKVLRKSGWKAIENYLNEYERKMNEKQSNNKKKK